MNYKLFIVLILIGTLLGWVNFFMMVMNFDPFQTDFLGFIAFYVSLLIALSGTYFLFASQVGERLLNRPLNAMRTKAGLRHGFMFSVLIVAWGFMKSQDILRWWNLLLLISILTVLEFLFISLERERKITPYEREDQPTPGAIQPGTGDSLGSSIPGRIGN